jgi:beta-galactosidase
MWLDTRYEPGTLKVVAYDDLGKPVAETEVHTAGKPHHIELSADRSIIKADGKDLCFINVRVVDKNGNLCPDDTREITFKVKGPGSYKAAANGNSICMVPFQSPVMPLFSGQLTAIVQSSETPGTINFEATATGVNPATLTFTGQQP